MTEDLKDKPDSYWKGKLTPEEYKVLRGKGTEPAFTGAYVDKKDKGIYKCRACGATLFSSDTKFDSGTGWPSFTDPMNRENIILKEDESHGMHRIEVVCKNCGSHLGHVFNDGPTQKADGSEASGQRYCINSCSLQFEPEKS